jgi:hypothetical protein
MFADLRRRGLLHRATVCVGFALATIGFAVGVAPAAPAQPAPADDPMLPFLADSASEPGGSSIGTLLTDAGTLLTDAGNIFNPPPEAAPAPDPSALPPDPSAFQPDPNAPPPGS